MKDTLVDFFEQKTEARINKSLLYCKDESKAAMEYIDKLLSIPLGEYVDYVNSEYQRKSISAKDVVQFSSFYDATIGICTKLKEIDNPGLKFVDIGRLLLDDGKLRKDGAYVKYGENHAKTATSLGLVFEFYNTYYLSCLGNIYIELQEREQKHLLDRLIIRSSLVARMLQASQNGRVNMREFLYMLSDSTYTRRKSNMRKMVDYLYQSEEYDFNVFIEKINF